MTDRFQWFNALSTRASLEGAIDEVVTQIENKFTSSVDLGILFISAAFTSEYSRVVELLTEKLPCKVLIGCGGASIIGTDPEQQPQELEDRPALSLTVAHLPEVLIKPFQLSEKDLPDPDSSPDAWTEMFELAADTEPSFLLFADPFSSSINDLLAGLDFAYPASVKLGGLASSGGMGVANGLFCYEAGKTETSNMLREGTVGVALAGNIQVDAIVAQGCRPIGEVYQINQSERNIITELSLNKDGETVKSGAPLKLLQELLSSLDAEDQVLAQDSLFVGIAMNEFKLKLIHGDFLIRNLLGVDPKTGAMAVGDRIRSGQRIQFHLRDAETSAEDLSVLLDQYREKQPDLASPYGALMFSCMGRGKGLYGELNFDANKFASALPTPSLGGFFCNGEIGPVGDRTFLHGYTSVFGIFRPKH
ncbi:MAG: FIST N-terminal domain-containing protein [Limnothrix sp.]